MPGVKQLLNLHFVDDSLLTLDLNWGSVEESLQCVAIFSMVEGAVVRNQDRVKVIIINHEDCPDW